MAGATPGPRPGVRGGRPQASTAKALATKSQGPQAIGGGPGGSSPRIKAAPMRLFHLSIAYLTLLFAAVAVTALLPWGHW